MVAQRYACREASEETASDCSTVADNQECGAFQGADSLSDSLSEAGLEVESLIIFDWDDTLFPTTWLQQLNLLKDDVALTEEQVAHLSELAERARSTLQMALEIGKVLIVTNAQGGWIETSCQRFMPSLVGVLGAVDTISARSAYEKYSKGPSEWKEMAFKEEVELFYGSCSTCQQRNIVSVGDSLHEMNALLAVTKSMPTSCGKSIKLFDSPSIQQLIAQHEMLAECFMDVVEYNGDLDVAIGTEQ